MSERFIENVELSSANSTEPIDYQEILSKNMKQKSDILFLPARTYFERTVVSILLQGMSELVRERPKNPIEYLACYLQKNKSKYGE